MVNFIFKGVSLVILLPTLLFAQNLTLDFFKDKPKSLTKDFYISQYLDQNITTAQANAIIPQIKNINNKMLFMETNFSKLQKDFLLASKKQEQKIGKLEKQTHNIRKVTEIKKRLYLSWIKLF